MKNKNLYSNRERKHRQKRTRRVKHGEGNNKPIVGMSKKLRELLVRVRIIIGR